MCSVEYIYVSAQFTASVPFYHLARSLTHPAGVTAAYYADPGEDPVSGMPSSSSSSSSAHVQADETLEKRPIALLHTGNGGVHAPPVGLNFNYVQEENSASQPFGGIGGSGSSEGRSGYPPMYCNPLAATASSTAAAAGVAGGSDGLLPATSPSSAQASTGGTAPVVDALAARLAALRRG